jgi:hypothetical protein
MVVLYPSSRSWNANRLDRIEVAFALRIELGTTQVVRLLQVQPEASAILTATEELCQAERRIGRDRTNLVENSGDPVGGDAQASRQRPRGESELLELLSQNLSRVNRSELET